MLMPPTEKELDLALSQALTESQDFLQWFVSHTKFADRQNTFASCRADHPWGTHPFSSSDQLTGASVETRRQSETDVLLILHDQNGSVLGLHIENKIGTGSFTAHQPEMYWHRANHWIGNPHYGGYTDFDTVLIAPAAFLDRNAHQAKHFGSFISHEDIAPRIPLFQGRRLG